MDITDVRIKLLGKEESKLRAVVSIVIDDAFVVHDIKIIEGNDGDFIVMPSKKAPDGSYRDIAHPLRTEIREQIKDRILKAYAAAKRNEEL